MPPLQRDPQATQRSQAGNKLPTYDQVFPPNAGLTPVPGDDKDRQISKGTAYELVHSRWFKEGKDEVAIGLAVMEAESSRRTHAVSPTGCCHGIWQLNLQAHPSVSLRCAQSPICSTDVAYNLYKARKANFGEAHRWDDWSAYTDGSYKQFLGDTTIKDASAKEGGLSGLLPGSGDCGIVPGPICKVVQGFAVLFDRDFWIRVIKVVGGLALLGAGLLIIARSYTIGEVGKAVGGNVGRNLNPQF